MNSRLFARGLMIVSQLLLVGLFSTGCQTGTPQFKDPATGAMPVQTPKTGEVPTRGSDAAALSDVFAPGEQVRVTFSGIPNQILPHEERIKDDGYITLPLIGAVKAAGKSPGELQKEIHALYVPKYYVRLTVTVSSQERVFYVGGQVRSPGRQIYIGVTTVTKAIQSAGDFTDFADRKRVKLIRSGQNPMTVNCVKALEDPSTDPLVFPGDKIDVPQRWW